MLLPPIIIRCIDKEFLKLRAFFELIPLGVDVWLTCPRDSWLNISEVKNNKLSFKVSENKWTFKLCCFADQFYDEKYEL